jgi:CO/xanthine dehydrogenase Mo-binding subunit
MAEAFNEKKPWLWRPPKGKYGYIGRRGLHPKEAPEKVTGKQSTPTMSIFRGMLYAKVYRSPHAHARIKSLDSSKAEALPGVWSVIRYDNTEANLRDTFKEMQPGAPWFWWRESLLPILLILPAQGRCDRGC